MTRSGTALARVGQSRSARISFAANSIREETWTLR